MLAKSRPIEDSPEVPTSHLKVVTERRPGVPRLPEPIAEPPQTVIGRAMARVREAVREEPERYRKFADGVMVLGIVLVVVVGAYLLLTEPR